MMLRYVPPIALSKASAWFSVADVSTFGGGATRGQMEWRREALEVGRRDNLRFHRSTAVWICTPTAMHRRGLYRRGGSWQAHFL